MHVIAKSALVEFWTKHPDAEEPLMTWYRTMKKEAFTDFADLRSKFASADYVDDLIIFNIGGNKYRLIAAIHFNRGKVYERARAIMNALIDEVRGNEAHPLADLLEYLGEQMEAWEDEHVQIPDAEPRDVLRFFMEEHSLKPEDLADCAPPDRISEILEGKREISTALAKKLAQRFHVHANLFL